MLMLFKNFWLAAVLVCTALNAAAQNTAAAANLPPVSAIATLDVPRYMGTWYEVAKFPNWFQTKCAANTRAQYLAQTDGSVQVLNSCATADGSTMAQLAACGVG
jgi:apolipoprotein D and lipocalin family protein